MPFAATKEEREASGDPRPFIEERCYSRDHHLDLVTKASQERIGQGYLIEEELEELFQQDGHHYDLFSRVADSGRRRFRPRKTVYSRGIAGSNPTLSARCSFKSPRFLAFTAQFPTACRQLASLGLGVDIMATKQGESVSLDYPTVQVTTT